MTWRDLPRSIWALGFVSLFMDISSESIHSLLPLFLVGVLGASTTVVGVIEGVAEATAAIAKVFSGVLSDRIGRRKLLVVLGYGLSAVTKPIFPLAAGAGAVLAARFLDRIGKGVRDAPRDALMADITPEPVRGAAYGLRQALDTVGAIGGPLLAMALMLHYADDFRTVFWWAVVPAALGVALAMLGVEEPAVPRPRGEGGWPIRRESLARLSGAYWWVVGLGVVFSLARFSEAFLVLQAQAAGLAIGLVPLVMVFMNGIYAAIATPAGALSDRIGRRELLIAGLAVLVAADLSLALVPGIGGVFLGVGLWGASLGLSQGLLAALIGDTAPEDLRGTAFGIFNLLTGAALLLASTAAGALWARFGATVAFETGAVFAALAALGFILTPSRPSPVLPGQR